MIKNKVILTFTALALCFSLSTGIQAKTTFTVVSPGTDASQLASREPIHWVSVEQISQSLQGKPAMAVGFDIDDTVLFSSPGFYRGSIEFKDHLNNPDFWQKMNNEWELFSMPKKIGIDLVKMHLDRGDTVYFITGRDKTTPEGVTAYLQKVLDVPANKMNPVIFTSAPTVQKNTKVEWMRDHELKIYYGDADSDITAAIELGIRGIRILRAANSSYQPLPKAGRYGEEVVINSEY